jgi:hypothetical protein
VRSTLPVPTQRCQAGEKVIRGGMSASTPLVPPPLGSFSRISNWGRSGSTSIASTRYGLASVTRSDCAPSPCFRPTRFPPVGSVERARAASPVIFGDLPVQKTARKPCMGSQAVTEESGCPPIGRGRFPCPQARPAYTGSCGGMPSFSHTRSKSSRFAYWMTMRPLFFLRPGTSRTGNPRARLNRPASSSA